MNIPSSYPKFFVMRDSILCVIALLRAKGHDNSSSQPTRQSWHAHSVHRYSRWRHWFYSCGRLRPYTFTWISKTNDASLRSCQLTLLWKVYHTLPVRLSVRRASLLTRNELGQYRALEWHEGDQKYKENPRMGVLVEVTVRTPNSLRFPS